MGEVCQLEEATKKHDEDEDSIKQFLLKAAVAVKRALLRVSSLAYVQFLQCVYSMPFVSIPNWA
jgi:hypothetical protein